MFINLKLTFLFSLCFFSLLANSGLRSKELIATQDSTIQDEIEIPLRFGIVYSPFQGYRLVNNASQKHICGSFFNLGYLVDYYITKHSFASFNFGTLYYTDFIHNHSLYIDYKISHLYYGDLSYFYNVDVFHIGLGLGMSYLFFYREYETDPTDENTEYEYYLFENINTSLDMAIRFGFEIVGTYNIDFRYSFALENLRDIETDLKSKSIFGITLSIKLPRANTENQKINYIKRLSI